MTLRSKRKARKTSQLGFSTIELIVVMLIAGIVAAFAIPGFVQMQRTMRVSGDARSLAGMVGLAKMRASADFTQARVYFDLAAGTFRLEKGVKNAAGNAVTSWQTEPPGDPGTPLSQGVTPGFGGVGAPPPNTQPAIGQAPACLDSASNTGAVANTACIVFNSRGIPVDNAGNPTALGAFYVTNGTQVFAVTVNAMGRGMTWSFDARTGNWIRR